MPSDQAQPRDPILVVRTYQTELASKAAGGGPPGPPFVAVDSLLRQSLANQLMVAIGEAREVPQLLHDAGLPLAIELREAALAKSNRPYKLLARANLPVEASVGRKKIVARAVDRTLEDLSGRVVTEVGPRNEREISSIASLAIWDPVTDAMGVEDPQQGLAVLRRYQDAEQPVVLELFPWLSAETAVDTTHTLAQYLAAIGFIVQYESKTGRPSLYADLADPSVEGLHRLAGIRALYPVPSYATDEPASITLAQALPAIDAPGPSAPVVGVLDTGVEPGPLGGWLAGADRYVVPLDEDASHGTFVAGLIANARALNGGDPRFPEDRCRVFDARILPRGGLWEYELMNRITEAVEKNKDEIETWNCSFGLTGERPPGRYTQFAAFMDETARKNSVTFVQAAGNYRSVPPRTWPPQGVHLDGLQSPGEAISSITVGSLTHLQGAVTAVGSPASYTRRGPGLDGVMKPDVCHYSGDVDSAGDCGNTGLASYNTTGGIRRSVGTSYATPLVSAIVATVMDSFTAPGIGRASKNLVARALLMHSARQSSAHVSHDDRAYFGSGVPPTAVDVLSDAADTFTTLYLVQFTGASEWVKREFPIPSCLVNGGKLQAEVFMTVAHDAIVDPAFDGECVRTSVDGQLGPIAIGKRGLPTVASKVPVEAALSGWETDLIDRGKWSPIRTHHESWPRGTALGGEWGLKLGLLERLERVSRPVQVAVLVTFKALRPGLPVRADGVRALQAANHIAQELTPASRVRLRS